MTILGCVTAVAAAPSPNDLNLPKTPPASAIGQMDPTSAVVEYRPMTPQMLSRLLPYVASQAQTELPPAMLNGEADFQSSVGLEDRKSPFAVFIPAKDLTSQTIAGASDTGVWFGWLLLRYATLPDPPGEVPDRSLGHLVFPGPMRMTFIPIRAVKENGLLRAAVIGTDGKPVYFRQLFPMDSAQSLVLGEAAVKGGTRKVSVSNGGYSTTIEVGAPPANALLPRPMEGTLKVGDAAPDFELKTVDGEKSIRLHASRGKMPVVLVFGSYT